MVSMAMALAISRGLLSGQMTTMTASQTHPAVLAARGDGLPSGGSSPAPLCSLRSSLERCAQEAHPSRLDSLSRDVRVLEVPGVGTGT